MGTFHSRILQLDDGSTSGPAAFRSYGCCLQLVSPSQPASRTMPLHHQQRGEHSAQRSLAA